MKKMQQKTGAMTLKSKKVPMRRCVGCMESKPKNELVRVACYEGKVTVDPTGKAKGRGVYLCRNKACMEKAKKRRSLQRSFETEITAQDMENIFAQLEQYEQESN